MNKINQISLHDVVPDVFVGDTEMTSGVWRKEVSFVRPSYYMVEAESGTGKSSLCSFVYGNRRDYQGVISFDGRDIRTFSVADWCEVRRRHLALLPQELRLFPELTAVENIMIKNRLTDTFTELEIRGLLDRFGIGDKANVVAGHLSVGQQQRVAVIRALAQPFDFILLDEPVSHLDVGNNQGVARLVVEMARRNEASIITTSVGNPLALMELADVTDVVTIKL